MATDHEPEQEAEDKLDEDVFIGNLEVKDGFDEKTVLVEDKKMGALPITGMRTTDAGTYVFECRIEPDEFKKRFNIAFPNQIVGKDVAVLPMKWFEALRGESILGKSTTKRKYTSSNQDKPTNVKKKSPDEGKISLEDFKELGSEDK